MGSIGNASLALTLHLIILKSTHLEKSWPWGDDQVVDCNDASSKECHHAKHAANAFDTEKVALMHGIFQLLQTPPGNALSYCRVTPACLTVPDSFVAMLCRQPVRQPGKTPGFS